MKTVEKAKKTKKPKENDKKGKRKQTEKNLKANRTEPFAHVARRASSHTDRCT